MIRFLKIRRSSTIFFPHPMDILWWLGDQRWKRHFRSDFRGIKGTINSAPAQERGFSPQWSARSKLPSGLPWTTGHKVLQQMIRMTFSADVSFMPFFHCCLWATLVSFLMCSGSRLGLILGQPSLRPCRLFQPVFSALWAELLVGSTLLSQLPWSWTSLAITVQTLACYCHRQWSYRIGSRSQGIHQLWRETEKQGCRDT